jgi:hypothetical protein
MDEARAVLERLERIEALDRVDAPAGALLDELRALVTEAEAWVRAERPGTRAEAAAERCRLALDPGRKTSGPREAGPALPVAIAGSAVVATQEVAMM